LALEEAAQTDWSPALDVLKDADRMFVIGRGTCLPIALEAALKFVVVLRPIFSSSNSFRGMEITSSSRKRVFL